VYPAPESPQALGLVTQSLHLWCLTHRLLLVLVRLLGAPPTGGTHLESNAHPHPDTTHTAHSHAVLALVLLADLVLEPERPCPCFGSGPGLLVLSSRYTICHSPQVIDMQAIQQLITCLFGIHVTGTENHNKQGFCFCEAATSSPCAALWLMWMAVGVVDTETARPRPALKTNKNKKQAPH
jgi:hypothetical protein